MNGFGRIWQPRKFGDLAALLYAGVMARTPRKTPVELAPAPWPDLPATAEAEIARRFVVNIRGRIDGRSIRSIAVLAGIHHTTLLQVLNGRAWPDLETIAKIERALDADLWPGRIK